MMLEYKVDYEAAYKELVKLLHDGINKELNKHELFNQGYSEAMHLAWLESMDIIQKHITTRILS